MGSERGFLEHARQDAGYRPVEQRRRDFKAVENRLPADDLRAQASRCMDCGVPFCHGCGCPLGNHIPEFNDLAYRRRWREALDIVLATNPFPDFTGRICPAPCEASCVLGINDEAVTIRQIEMEIFETGFERGYVSPRPPARRRGGRVAVVGSGPAGLACAAALNASGLGVVVYESAARPGGVLRYGIPDFKLEKWVVDRRIRLMEEEGVAFETGVEIGRDVSFGHLRRRHDAVVLTGGAREPRDLPAPGRDLAGIHFAMPFLARQNRRLAGEEEKPGGGITAAGKSVLVVGGGDTGADCVGTAIRQGARRVLQIEIMPEPPAARSPSTPWPDWPLVRRDSSSHAEGGQRRWSATVKRFEGEGGAVARAVCAEVVWADGAGGGRPAPEEKPGAEFTVEADLVLLATGFVGPGRIRGIEELGLEMDGRGFVRRDEARMTSAPGVFAAGDMAQGASLAVKAMADGLAAAAGVDAYVAGREGGRSK